MHNKQQKNKILIYAKSHTLKETSDKFSVHHNTILSWKKKKKDKDKDKDKDKAILALKKKHPELTAGQIKERLYLSCSLQTIYSILNNNKQQEELSAFILGIKKVPDYQLYIYFLQDLQTNFIFACYSATKEKPHLISFLHRTLSLFEKHHVQGDQVIIYTPRAHLYNINQTCNQFPFTINLKRTYPSGVRPDSLFKQLQGVNFIFKNEIDFITYQILSHNISMLNRKKTVKTDSYNKLIQNSLLYSLENEQTGRLNSLLNELEGYGNKLAGAFDHQAAYDIFIRMLEIIDLNDTNLTEKKIFTLIRSGMSAHKFLGDITAKKHYKKAYQLAKTKGNDYAIANAEYFYGYILFKNSKFDSALKLYLSSLNRFKNINDDYKISIVSGHTAEVLFYKKIFNKAFQYAVLSLRSAKKIKDNDRICTALIEIARILREKKYYRMADRYYHIVIHVAEEINNITHQATAHNNLAVMYSRQKENKKSEEYSLKASSLNIKTNDDSRIVADLTAAGLREEQKKDYEAALTHFFKALSIHLKYKNHLHVAKCYKNIARMNALLHKKRSAGTYYKKALDVVNIHNLSSLKESILQAVRELDK